MATIDTQSFNLTGLSLADTHILQQSHVPGTSKNPINDLGYSGLQLRIKGFEETRTAYDAVIAAFMQEGEIDLIIDSGWKFKVHGARHTKKRAIGHSGRYPYDLTVITDSPFLHTTSSTTRSKSITSDGQQWSADDSSNDIDTDGNVAAAPDIKVTGGAAGSYVRVHEEIDDSDGPTTTTGSSTYVLMATLSYPSVDNLKYYLDYISVKNNATDGKYKVTYSLNGGAEQTIVTEQTTVTTTTTHDVDVTSAAGDTLDIKYYLRFPSPGAHPSYVEYGFTGQALRKAIVADIDILNTADEDTVCSIANLI